MSLGDTGFTVVFEGVVVLVFGLALALTFAGLLATAEPAIERVFAAIFATRLAAGTGLTVVFFLRVRVALAIDFERFVATFFELDFLLSARWVRALVVFLAGKRAAFARLAFLLGAVRWGTCLAALRRTTGTRLLMVSGFQRERLCRGLRANRRL